MAKGASIGLGCQALASDLGIGLQLRLWTDSSAAIGVAVRHGVGKIGHLDAKTLSVQQAVRTGGLEVREVEGTENPADLFTKHLPSQAKVYELVRLFGCEYRDGRAAAAPLLRPMDKQQVNNVSSIGALPHLKSQREIESSHPRMYAPEFDELEDTDSAPGSQAELWVVTDSVAW